MCNYKLHINIGNQNEYSILKLVEIIKVLTKSKSNIIYKDLPENDPKVRQPDISLAMNVLNWQPQVQIEEGLIKTIKYYHNFHNFEK